MAFLENTSILASYMATLIPADFMEKIVAVQLSPENVISL